MAKKSTEQLGELAIPGGSGALGLEAARDLLGHLIGTPKGVEAPVATLTPQTAAQRLEAERAARGLPQGPAAKIAGGTETLAQAGQKASVPTPAQPKQQSVQDLLSAILGGQTGTIPQGYANFFTDVLGPMMNQQSQQFDQQLKATGADPNVIANLMAINDATAKQTGLGAQGLQQFVQGPLSNYQKLVQQLQNALSFIPYSAQGIAQLPVQASSVLGQLGINPAAASFLPGAASGQAPSLTSPGAAVVAGG